MAGFGHGAFGSSPFGRADWSRLAVTGNLPRRMLDEDAAAEGIFQKIMTMAEDGLDFPMLKIRDFANLRDAYRVQSRFTKTESVTVTSVALVTDPSWGTYVSLTVGGPFSDIGAGWKTFIAGEAELEVLRVRKEDQRIDVLGSVTPSLGSLTFYEPEQLTKLYKDVGLIPDRYFDETYLRAEIAHAVQWLGLKGSEKGYEIRGQASGYSIEVEKLYSVSETYLGLLAVSEYFEYPSGSGEYLTSVAPKKPAYDDIRADVIEADRLCSDLIASGELVYSYTISTVTASTDSPLTGSSRHLIEFATDVDEPVLLDRWYVVDADGNEFWLEERVSATEFYVAGLTLPVAGAAEVKYDCEEMYDCDWCPTHYLRLVISPSAELLAAFVDSSGDATDRMLKKIEQVKPAHVVFASVIERHETEVSASGGVTSTSLETVHAVAGALVYDVPGVAGEFETDQTTGPGVTDTY